MIWAPFLAWKKNLETLLRFDGESENTPKMARSSSITANSIGTTTRTRRALEPDSRLKPDRASPTSWNQTLKKLQMLPDRRVYLKQNQTKKIGCWLFQSIWPRSPFGTQICVVLFKSSCGCTFAQSHDALQLPKKGSETICNLVCSILMLHWWLTLPTGLQPRFFCAI